MFAPFWLTAPAAALLSGEPISPTAGYLRTMPSAHAKAAAQKAIPYTPREGDLIFYDDHNIVMKILFAWAGSGPPSHMGIVVKKPDGSLAVLEAGPDDTVARWFGPHLSLAPVSRRYRGSPLQGRAEQGEVGRANRFRRGPESQRYAVLRFLLQGTPFRPRGLLAPFVALPISIVIPGSAPSWRSLPAQLWDCSIAGWCAPTRPTRATSWTTARTT